ncbi:MAG TPA: alpha/beta hydrolase [Vicinamibacterales bacterium]
MILAAAFVAQVALALAPCSLEGVTGQARCGTYAVREDRAATGGSTRTIDLSVIVLEALEPANELPDPFFMLAGGPGDAPSFNARFFSRVFHDIRRKRDIVLVDLRGTGRSSPLFCPELAAADSSGIHDEHLLSAAAVRACRARLEQTRDLSKYTTEIAVDDLEEVRQRLGYGAINLYGTSYGSRVAQVYMRRYPNSIRAAAMKGIVPPSMAMPETHARAGETALQALFARCRKDSVCRETYPLADVQMRELLKRLESNPVMTLPAGSQGFEKRIRVSRGLFAEAFRNVLYTPEGLAQAPKLIHQLVNGDDRGIVETALSGRNALGGERLAAGFFLSVTCTEDIPYLSPNADAMAAGTFGGAYRLDEQRAACREWVRGAVSADHRQPARSAIPTLLLSGEFDPVTPPSGGDEVARYLSNARHVIIRNNGHPIGNAEKCIGMMIGQLLDRRSAEGIDARCAAATPALPFAIAEKNKP